MPAGSAMNLSPVNMPSLLKPPSAALLKTHSANATSHRKAFRPLTDYFSNQSRTASSSAKKHTKRNVHVYSDDSDVSLRSSLDYASHEVETDEEEEHLDGQDEEEECVSLSASSSDGEINEQDADNEDVDELRLRLRTAVAVADSLKGLAEERGEQLQAAALLRRVERVRPTTQKQRRKSRTDEARARRAMSIDADALALAVEAAEAWTPDQSAVDVTSKVWS